MKTYILIIGLLCGFCFQSASGSGPVSDANVAFSEKAQLIRTSLAQARSAANLTVIEQEIGALPQRERKQPGWAEWRLMKLAILGDALKRVHQMKDPTFDWSRDVPSMNGASPPIETGLPVGVSPEAITDPLLRAKYEQDIAVWRQKKTRCDEQVALRRVESSLTMLLRGHIRVEYEPKDHANTEVENVLSVLPPEQKEKVRMESANTQ